MKPNEAFSLLERAFRAGRTAHAYVFAGAPRGAAGELAVRMIQLLACKAENAPCGTCDTCRQIRERVWADALWVQPEKKSRAISVEAIRDTVLPFATQTAFLGGWKAVVFVGADCLNEAAANAFLLTLEEPPPKTLFLLLTDAPQFLLPTIASRCQRIEVSDEADSLGSRLKPEWRDRVIGIIASIDNAGPASAMAATSRMCDLLDEMKRDAESQVRAASAEEAESIDEDKDILEARISALYRESRRGALECVMSWYRDLLALRAGGDESLVMNADRIGILRERAKRLTLSQSLSNIDGVEELSRQLDRSIAEQTLLAYWLDRLYGGVK